MQKKAKSAAKPPANAPAPWRRILIISMAALGLSACAPDRTIDDWRKERVRQELARQSAVAGVYSGDLTASDGEGPSGQLWIELIPSTRLGNTSDSAGVQQQAIVRGNISLVSDVVYNLAFNDGFYDSNSGDFRASVSIPLRNGEKATLDLVGSIEQGRLTGTISAFGFPERGGRFVLTHTKTGMIRDRLEKEPGKEPGRVPPPLPSTFQRYKGTAQYLTGERYSTELVLLKHQPTPEQAFVSPFLGVRIVDATIDIAGLRSHFSNVQWDLRSHSFVGEVQGTTGAGGEQYKQVLECHEMAEGWHCFYVTSRSGLLFTVDFKPVAPVL